MQMRCVALVVKCGGVRPGWRSLESDTCYLYLCEGVRPPEMFLYWQKGTHRDVPVVEGASMLLGQMSVGGVTCASSAPPAGTLTAIMFLHRQNAPVWQRSPSSSTCDSDAAYRWPMGLKRPNLRTLHSQTWSRVGPLTTYPPSITQPSAFLFSQIHVP